MSYFTSSEIIYLAMNWTFRDYFIFDIQIPEWICVHDKDDSFDKLVKLLNDKFINKRHLLPNCVTVTKVQ